MEKEDYIKVIEELNDEYKKLLNSKSLIKIKHRRRNINLIKSLKFNILWKRVLFDIIKKFKPSIKVSKLDDTIPKKRKGKIIVYTCIVGNYDSILDIVIPSENADYIVFSDNKNIANESNYWQYRPLPSKIKEKCQNNPVLINRYVKMHPKELFPDYDLSLYVDGSVRIMSDIGECFYFINDKTGLALHDHPVRNDVYEEARSCIKQGVGIKKNILKLIRKYEEESFPKLYGLFEAGIIASDLNNESSFKILDMWYKEFIKSKTMRDQLIFPYILWKNNFSCNDVGILGHDLRKNPKFILYSHF